MSVQAWTYIFVAVTFAIYLFIAWISRVRTTKGFYVAGQGVPAIANGMATGADWMSAASFISMSGLISTMGYAGGVYLMGWTGGYVLLALLLAPYLRKFGHFTVPDFIGDRYDSSNARLVAVACAIFVSFTYVVGQMKGVGVVLSRLLEVPLPVRLFIGMAIVFVYATLGGMKGITWTQVAQYWVLITAFLIPAIAISIKLTGNVIPQLGLGGQVLETVDATRPFLLEKLNSINQDFGFASYTGTFVSPEWSKLNVFCVALALMAGTAGLPHVIIRFYTVRTVQAARWSAFWALLFIAILYVTAPAVAAFARYYMVDDVAGLNGKRASDLPSWYESWKKSGLICWFDLNQDGRVQLTANTSSEIQFIPASESYDGVKKAIPPNEVFKIDGIPTDVRNHMIEDSDSWIIANGGPAARETLLELGAVHQPDRDIIVLATPEMAELYGWIIALVAAGGLAAALSTASGLLLVISSSVAHDLYYRLMNPQATEQMRLRVGRIVIGFAVMVAGYFGVNPPGFVGEVVAFAFGLAAASFFPAIVLGIFSKRVGTVPAVAGMLVGVGFTAFYILTQTADRILTPDVANAIFGIDSAIRQPWLLGINAQGIGTVGMLLNFAVTLGLTPFCKGPSDEVKDMIDSVREPEGFGPALDIETAPEH
ncbi:MAG: cation acetate symporter [Acidobacteriota bacterium]|nr:MAG: cation acetate symporter [Acidobacteriota bacterium]